MNIKKEDVLQAIRAMKTPAEIDKATMQAELFMVHASAGEKAEIRQVIRERALAIRQECNLAREQALAHLSPQQRESVLARLT